MGIANNGEREYAYLRHVRFCAMVRGLDRTANGTIAALSYGENMTVRLTHSFSAIKMFENCPLQYYRVRILKDVVSKGGEATIWGERIHEQLEDRLKTGVALPPESSSYEPIVSAIERIAPAGGLFVEQEVTLNDKLQPTGWWDPDAWLRSKLDVQIMRPPVAYVIDWKTGKRRLDPTQLELFALQVFSHSPEVMKVVSKFVWLKEGTSDSLTYKREQVPQMWADLLTRIKRIEQAAAANVWPAKPSGLCPWCPAKDTCPSARR